MVNSEQDLDRIMERTSVKRMKQQYKAFLVADFVRKGDVGDWKHHLSAEQCEIMDALIKLHFHGTKFKYYQDLMDEMPYLIRSKL